MDPNAFKASTDITFVIKNNSSINRSIKVFNTKIGPGNSLDLMKVPGVTEEDIRSALTKSYLKDLFSGGALVVTNSTVDLSTSDTAHAAFLNSIGLSGINESAGGLEVVTVATAAGSRTSPDATLSLTKQLSIIINTSGAAAYVSLPNATDGTIKEITNGANSGAGGTTSSYCFIVCNNDAFGGNDLLDLNTDVGVKMVWMTSLGGWVVLSITNGLSSLWD